MNILKALRILVVLSLFFIAPVASAQIAPLQGAQCTALGINCQPGNNTGSLTQYVLNVLNIFLTLLGVVALLMICVAGVRYITAQGDEGKIEQAKKTILYAVIGLIVVGLAAVTVNFTLGAAGISGAQLPGGSNLIGAALLILNIFLTLVGITALIYVLIGGIRYITAQGDEGKLEQAKHTILYAVIGLLVIGLAAIAVNFTAAAIGLPTGIPASNNLPLAIWQLINVALILAGLTALVYVILGGVRYITAQGDESKVEAAKNTILYAVIGLIVIGIAAVLVNFVITIFTGTGWWYT